MTEDTRPTVFSRSATDRADGVESRNRDLDAIDQIFRATGGPAEMVADLLRSGQPLDVLEVGFGYGVALLQLAWQFRDRPVSFHGVDLEPKPDLASAGSVHAFAVRHGIVGSADVARLPVPRFDFYDATTLELPDESMDLVYSAVTIRFMADKVTFIEEVSRVLRPGGRALLHIGESKWNYPTGPAAPAPLLTGFTSRLVLRHRDQLVALPDYVALFTGDGFDLRFTTEGRCILVMSKLAPGRLDLELTLDHELTLPGREVPLVNHKGEVRGGTRSVYVVNDIRYRQLVGLH